MVCTDRKADTIKQHLRKVFASFGVPKTIVSDNAFEVGALELNTRLDNIGCIRAFSPAYHQSSNGLSEMMVRTLKDALKKRGVANLEVLRIISN